jgi:oligoendopeptidase F
MKFSDFPYVRPDLEQIKKDVEGLLALIGTNQPFDVELDAIKKFFDFNDHIMSSAQLVGVRNSIDTNDKFYEEEQNFFDENVPHLKALENIFQRRF